ncbi:hypothetical protein NBRC116590_03740 [Pelagimonas sp. KU-00592-HH]|uniref:hypothetical protein n=1 Tax=Pelagimonas sp. KU-00592-HH TaxID=3127651 RepID=UPI003106DB55
MKTGFLTTALFLVATLSGAATAQAEHTILQCKVQNTELGRWISPEVVIAYSPGSKKAIVSDPIIMHFYKRPLEAKVKDRKSKISLYWRVKNVSDSAAQALPSMEYSATIFKGSPKFTISARPQGRPQTFSGRGTCSPLKNVGKWKKYLKNL